MVELILPPAVTRIDPASRNVPTASGSDAPHSCLMQWLVSSLPRAVTPLDPASGSDLIDPALKISILLRAVNVSYLSLCSDLH